MKRRTSVNYDSRNKEKEIDRDRGKNIHKDEREQQS
jgi:hypothetical protein